MKFLWALIRYGFCFSLGGALVFAGFSWTHFHDKPANIGGDGYILQVKSGSSVTKVAKQLQADGLIKHDFTFALIARYQEKASKIKAGEYELKAGMTQNDILDTMIAGKSVNYFFTIVEGKTFKDILASLTRRTSIKNDLKGKNVREAMDFLGYPTRHYEGRFLPDTYSYQRNDTASSILMRAYKAMEKTLNDEWQQRESGLPYKSPYEALIMASIIEKETGYKGEREKVSGVFVRRLQQNWKLQTDPTVIYGLGDEYKGDITYKHLRTPTPYNTYTMKGLPPTPIAMPGKKAIRAAMHPDDGKHMFFVADGSGGHKFSVTNAEHERAVDCYIRKRSSRCDK